MRLCAGMASADTQVRVVRGPGITAEEAGDAAGDGGRQGAEQGLYVDDCMSVALPHGMHGLESLDPHLDTEESKGVKGEYGEYVRSVLRFVEGEDAVVGGCVREEEVERAVEWLLILRYNQHAISCDLTGDMLGNMISPAGSLFNHACDANIGLGMKLWVWV